jgi:hypothetical protein
VQVFVEVSDRERKQTGRENLTTTHGSKKHGDREKAYVCAGIRTKREGERESTEKTKLDCAKSDHARQACPKNNVYLCEEQKASQASEECRSGLLNRTEWSVR